MTMADTTDAQPAREPLDPVEVARSMKNDLAKMIEQLDALIAESRERSALLAERIAELEPLIAERLARPAAGRV